MGCGVYAVMNHAGVLVTILLGCIFSLAQTSTQRPKLPCKYDGEMLEDTHGKTLWLTSDQMKRRAIYKVDVSGFVRNADISGAVMLRVLVSPSGSVICLGELTGHPLLLAATVKAVEQWKFKPMSYEGRKVAYAGQMVFRLCNINCGKSGPSMTLLK